MINIGGKKMKKLLFVLVLCVVSNIFVGCKKNDANDTVYVGGLYARSEINDMMLALFKIDGEPMVVITEYGNTYYGSYITEYEKLSDGTIYTKITVQDKTYGYHFYEDLTGILVDQEGNKYEAKKLDESVAEDMLKDAQRT